MRLNGARQIRSAVRTVSTSCGPHSGPHGVRRSVAATLLLLLPLASLIVVTGCTRQFFRAGADQEVGEVLHEKDPRWEWKLDNYYVYPHPVARFADPANPDRPPMPPDDPDAWLLSPHPQKPKQVGYIEGSGYLGLLAKYDAENRAQLAPASGQGNLVAAEYQPVSETKSVSEEKSSANEKPEPLPLAGAACPVMPQRPHIINLEQSIELAVLNSREFQARREDLYLVALPVTLERFAFAPQFEAINESIRERAGKESAVGFRNRWESNSNLGVSKLFSTGALLLIQFANQTVINLTGTDKHTQSQSTLILDLAQPLLRGGGRAVTLEALTQAERDLLYELRDYARFHKDFFVNIAAGAPTLGGGGGGDFGGIQLSVRGQARAVGYYPTLQRLSQLQDEQQNVEALTRLFGFFQAYAEGGAVSALQVDQVEQDLLRARSNVLQSRLGYQDSLDQFKIQLGIPTNFPLELDFTLLQPLREQMLKYEQIEKDYTEAVTRMAKLERGSLAELRAAVANALSTSRIVAGTRFQAEILARWQVWESLGADLDRMSFSLLDVSVPILAAPLHFQPPALAVLGTATRPSLLRMRLERLRRERDELEEQIDKLKEADKPIPADLEVRLNYVVSEIDLGNLESAIILYGREPWAGEQDPRRREEMRITIFGQIVNGFGRLVLQARGEKLEEVRVSWPTLPALSLQGKDLLKVDENEAQKLVGEVALSGRLDLMNQRARLVDGWRQIAVFANSLLGTFDVRYNMEVITPPFPAAKPLDFDGFRGRHRLFLNTELPLVRKLERNNYRAVLIAYQRQRRELMSQEDQILFQVRQNVRQLRQLAENYKIQQRALELAYLQVDNALETFQAPPAPNEVRDVATSAAALTQQLLNAQQRLPRAQDQLFSVWVSYLTTRMELYRDLELMQVDSRGVWIDEFGTANSPPPGNEPAGPADERRLPD